MQESNYISTEPSSSFKQNRALLSPIDFIPAQRRGSDSDISEETSMKISNRDSVESVEILTITPKLPFQVTHSSFNARSPNSPFRCRICLDASNWEDMISPCLCKGSVKYVHKQCLEQWIRYSQKTPGSKNICELCHTEIALKIENATIEADYEFFRDFKLIIPIVVGCIIIAGLIWWIITHAQKYGVDYIMIILLIVICFVFMVFLSIIAVILKTKIMKILSSTAVSRGQSSRDVTDFEPSTSRINI
ncbi:unnamed protein product [Blepharisma stoltei]|uniref:RING-CH-type domain-containing protein n=1 Tax=Blepharisma stoltei TaxID=1481888 RepID=A0AAU9JPC8_9CILI|nr:unnamed protein product [Blepharisma stoltei]